MSVRYNEKGKYFTEVVNKDQVKAMIQTTSQRLQGMVHVRPGMRLKDSLNEGPRFIAITDGVFLDSDNQKLNTFEFMSLNQEQIVWVLPLEEEDPDLTPEEKAG